MRGSRRFLKVISAFLLCSAASSHAGAQTRFIFRSTPHAVDYYPPGDTTPAASPSLKSASTLVAGLDVLAPATVGRPVEISITNTGDATSDIPTPSIAGPFVVVADGCTSALSPGQTCVVAVAGSSAGDAALVGKLAFAGTALELDLSGSASGWVAKPSIAEPSLVSHITNGISPSTTPAMFTVTNAGLTPSGPVVASLTTGAADFVVQSGTCSSMPSVAIGASCTVAVARRATTNDPIVRTASLRVSFEGGGSATATVSGTSSGMLTPSSVSSPSPALVAALAPDVGEEWNIPLEATGGSGDKAYALTQGTLPPGVVLNTATGTISGKPTVPVAASYGPFKVTATDATNPTGIESEEFTVVVGTPTSNTSSWVSNLRGFPDSLGQGGVLTDDAYGIAAGSDGVYVTGYIEVPGLKKTDAFVARYTTSGQLTWKKRIGGADHDTSYSVALGGDGVYVAGNTFSAGTAGSLDAFLAKYSRTGDLLWTRTLGGANSSTAYGVAVDAEGVYISGNTTVIDGSAGLGDVFVARYSPSGTLEWSSRFGGNKEDGAFTVAVGPDAVYVGGTTGSTGSLGYSDAFVAKLSKTGSPIWRKTFGGDGGDDIRSIAWGPDGIYAGGSTNSSGGAGNNDILLVKLSESGDRDWTKVIGTPGSERAGGISLSDDIYFSSEIDDGTGRSIATDALVGRVTKAGQLVWLHSIQGAESYEWTRGISVQGDSLYTAGMTATPGGNSGGINALVARLNKDTNPAETLGGGYSHGPRAMQETAATLGDTPVSMTTAANSMIETVVSLPSSEADLGATRYP